MMLVYFVEEWGGEWKEYSTKPGRGDLRYSSALDRLELASQVIHLFYEGTDCQI
jgi:hypothetical protein